MRTLVLIQMLLVVLACLADEPAAGAAPAPAAVSCKLPAR
jgi:hypothetical protein